MKLIRIESKTLFLIFLAAGIFLIFVFSLKIGSYLKQNYLSEGKASFDRAFLILEEKVNSYVYGLQGIGGVYIVSDFAPTRKQVRDYAQFRNFFSNFPGVLGFGFIRKVDDGSLSSYLKTTRQQIRDFTIKTIGEKKFPERMIIECIEPIEVNKNALGLDVSSEENRREAALAAALTGEATLTGTIKLIQLGQENKGFLFLLPLYSVPYVPISKSDRVNKIVGWVYAPILISGIVEHLKSTLNPSLTIKVSEQTSRGVEEIFSTGRIVELKFMRTLYIGGRSWTVEGSYDRPDKTTIVDVLPILIFLTFSFVFTGMSYLVRRLLLFKN